MVDMVLATDMAIHFDLLKRFAAQSEEQPDLSAWTDQSLLFMMLLHLADIANPSRPFHLARGWAERVIQEFCEQVSLARESQPSRPTGVQRPPLAQGRANRRPPRAAAAAPRARRATRRRKATCRSRPSASGRR